MRSRLIAAAAVSLLAVAQSACSTLNSDSRPEVIATYTRAPILLDGKLHEAAWHKTPVYELVRSDEQYKNALPEVQKFYSGKGTVEPGKVRVLWDEKYLYVGIEFNDSDLVAEGTEDQLHHYQMGDVAEVFLKPLNQTWYWELYVTPAGKKTSFFFPGRGLVGLPSGFSKKPALPGMKVAAVCKGTLNNSWDKDKKWFAEMAIPRKELGMVGERLDPGVPWTIFFGRYNFTRYLPWKENSNFPHTKPFNYHYCEKYATLKMIKLESEGK